MISFTATSVSGQRIGRMVECAEVLNTGFFLSPPAEKTKTQEQNSSKKLKKKTQPLGGLSLPYAKLKKKLKLMKGAANLKGQLIVQIFCMHFNFEFR